MSRSPRFRARRARRAAWMLSAVAAGAAAALLTTLAVARTSRPTLKTARNASLAERIVVDSAGRTVYALKPETARHLLCRSSQCLTFWPPLKVSRHARLVKGPGVKGRLGRLRRGGFYQVTLAGHPLYRFSGDTARGQAGGNGIKSFGGTWHIITAGSASKTKNSGTPTTSTTTSTTTSSTYTNPYPGY